MKKYSLAIVMLFIFSSFYFHARADEVKDKTDASFVGDGSIVPINSSFVGDISNSLIDDTYGQEDVHQKTNTAFVGDNSSPDMNDAFAGKDFDKDVQEGTDQAFAGDRNKIRENYGN